MMIKLVGLRVEIWWGDSSGACCEQPG